MDGKIYSVPANVHRANVVWANPTVLKKANIDATKAPASVDAWIADMEKLKAAGVKAPLATSKGFAEEMVMEAVLLAELGPAKFTGLWKGQTDMFGADVTAALTKFQKILSFSNVDREAVDWPDALGYVHKGQSAYTLMGDWVAAQQLANKVPDSAYTYWPAPDTEADFQYLADSFTLPTNGADPDGAKCWTSSAARTARKPSTPRRALSRPVPTAS